MIIGKNIVLEPSSEKHIDYIKVAYGDYDFMQKYSQALYCVDENLILKTLRYENRILPEHKYRYEWVICKNDVPIGLVSLG